MNAFNSILQLLALGGFVLGVLGIALAIGASSQGRNARGGALLAFVGIVAGIVFSIIAQGLLIVDTTQRAVIFNVLTGELEQPRGPGISIVIPGVQQPFIYPISQQTLTFSTREGVASTLSDSAIQARSVDGQQVEVDLTIIFRLDATGDRINQIHRDWSAQPGGYIEGLIRPAVRSIVRDVVARLEAESIYGIGREGMQQDISERLTTSLGRAGINVSEVLVRNVNFTEQFTDAIERKQIEQQELQRAQTEATRVRTQATGRANAAIEEATGQAQAILIRAQAEAEALRLISEQIAANPNLIQYTYIQQLSDNVRLIMIPSNSPFLFDPSTFVQLGEDFSAPAVPQIEGIRDRQQDGGGN